MNSTFFCSCASVELILCDDPSGEDVKCIEEGGLEVRVRMIYEKTVQRSLHLGVCAFAASNTDMQIQKDKNKNIYTNTRIPRLVVTFHLWHTWLEAAPTHPPTPQLPVHTGLPHEEEVEADVIQIQIQKKYNKSFM